MRRLLVLTTLALAWALPSAAGAAPGWLPSGDVASSATQGLFDTKVVTDPAGAVTAVWNNGETAPGLLAATRSPITHAWSAPTIVSEAGTLADDVSLAVDAGGNVTALWVREAAGAAPRVQSAVRDAATGNWSAPRYVDDAAAVTGIRDTDLAVAADGTVHAIWITGFKSGSAHVWVSKRSSPGGGWDAPISIDDTPGTPSISGAKISVAPSGRAFAAWVARIGSDDRVQRAFVRDTGAWTSAGNLSESRNATSLALTPLPSGQFVAAWTDSGDGSGNPGTAWVKAVVDGPAFSATAIDLGRTTTATQVGNVLAASAASGTATVTWARTDGVRRVMAATWSGSSWQTQAVSPEGSGALPTDIAYDAAGNTHLAWVRSNAATAAAAGRVFVSTRQAGGSFGTPTDLSLGEADGRQARLAFDGAGNGVALWNYPGTFAYRIKAAGFDGAPPAFSSAGSAAVPASGIAGQSVSMTAAPLDVWGDPTIAWDFGDGTSGSGANVAHTYAAAGNYTVTVSATDQVGSASTTRTISVAPAGRPGNIGVPSGSTPKQVPEALLSGKKITFAALLKRTKKAKTCPKSATAAVNTRSKGKTYKGSARLKVATVKVDGKTRCKATGTLKLNRTPPTSLAPLMVKLRGAGLTTRTIKTVRG